MASVQLATKVRGNARPRRRAVAPTHKSAHKSDADDGTSRASGPGLRPARRRVLGAGGLRRSGLEPVPFSGSRSPPNRRACPSTLPLATYPASRRGMSSSRSGGHKKAGPESPAKSGYVGWNRSPRKGTGERRASVPSRSIRSGLEGSTRRFPGLRSPCVTPEPGSATKVKDFRHGSG
jgi:hypothetical protein